MPVETEGESGLSAEAEAVLEDALRIAGSLHKAAQDRPVLPIRTVVQYVAETVSEADATAVLRQVVKRADNRKTLVMVSAQVDELRAMSWSAVSEIAEESGERATIAEEWIAACKDRMEAASAGPSWWRSHTLAEVREQASSGLREAREALAGFLAFSQRYVMSLK